MDTELISLLVTGFLAQLIDGALGMAFGVISTTAVISLGFAPAQASAIVHTAEVFTTGASASWHVFHGNVDWRMLARLGVAGVAGAVVGSWFLAGVDATFMRPFVFSYLLLMGVYILLRAMQWVKPMLLRDAFQVPLGLFGGFFDASGGGGWGPVTTTSLVGAGHSPRRAIGTVNTAEFFVTVAAATTFFFQLGASPWQQFVPLVLGGLFAAPLGGWLTKLIPERALMSAVGVLIVLLSLYQLIHGFGWIE